MEEEKRMKKRRKGDETHSGKKKKVLQIRSNAELEEAAAIKQAKSGMMISASDKSQWNPMFFSPNEKDINAAEKLTWNIGPFRDAEFKFHNIHPLVVQWKFNITVQEFDDTTGKPKTGAPEQKISLKPEAHGCYPWPTTGATGYFRKVRTSYNNFVTNDTEVLHSVNLDELNTIATMDLFLNPDEKYLQDVRHYGSVPLYNNGGNGMTWIKEKIGYMPNLNYPDNTAPAVTSNGEGYYFSYGRLPTPPFTKFSPRMKHKMAENSGGDTREEVSSIIFPPKTIFRIDFTKTAKENYLHEFYWPGYTDQMGSKQETLTNGVYAYRTYIGGEKTYVIKAAECDVKDIFLCGYIREISQSLKNRFPMFNTYCTARRLQEIKLDKDRFPILTYFIDQRSLGLGFILMFRRELDLERNSAQPHPFSSQTCFRPASLNRIQVLEGGDQGGDPITYNNMDINNLAYKKLDPSMRKFADTAVRQGWISLKQARRFWETPYTENTAVGTANVGDVGINNYFPVSLLDRSVRDKFDYFSTNGLKSNNLSIKLEFTEALMKQWYMIIISEYLVSITFDAKTGYPSFQIV